MDESESIQQAQDELIEAFEFFDSWTDRYQYIIDLGKQLPEFPEDWKTEDNRLRGCQSQVWLVAEREGGRVVFRAVSDSAIVSGLIALVTRVYSRRTPDEILATEPEFIDRIGLAEHLSPTRSNGLRAMLQKIRELAARAKAAN